MREFASSGRRGRPLIRQRSTKRGVWLTRLAVALLLIAAAGSLRAQTCPSVPSPRPLPASPLASLAPPGRIETTRVDGFTDDYLYSPNEEFKIGTRREWGSAVVFFGKGGDRPGFNGSNTIDAFDTGRELQVALYDYERGQQGCAWNASCLDRPEAGCGKNITFLGWNPVQGGDECNRGSDTDHVVMAPGRLEATLVPRFWNPEWKVSDCRKPLCDSPVELPNRSDVRYRQRLRFVASHAVEIFMEYTNLSNIDHPPAFQEFPTLYSSFGEVGQDLWKVVDSEGRHVPVNERSNDNFFTKEFDSPGGFAALQNERLKYGVGLYYETRQRVFRAYQRRGEFNNFRGLARFGLPARGKVRARAYLLIGSYETIAGSAARLDKRIGPFGDLDTPQPDAVVDGNLTVSGWVLDNWDVTHVELLLDGELLAETSLSESRPDVCALWPGYKMCRREVGFVAEASLQGVSRCPHLLEVRATDTHGNTRPIARRRILVGARRRRSGPDCDPAPGSTHPVYRFSWANGRDSDHSFSRTDEPPPNYAGEGIAFRLFTNPGSRRVALWQTWCAPCTDHLQTFNAEEGAPLYSSPVLLGYCSRVKTQQASRELRRLSSGPASDHLMSADPAEWTAAAAQGYVSEGRCWIP